MNERRKRLVGMAFSKMDKDGNGFIDPEDIIDTYDASKHPDVLAGKKSAEEVFREFLDTFDVGGEKDGKVTRHEFENYYANVSSSIDDDDYFELMIRNAWHISGGEGWCANTSNRRVLVTHADGRQTVEEIKDDLGIQPDDKAGMMRALRSQGLQVHDVSLTDAVKDEKSGNNKKASTASVLNRYKHRSVDESVSRRRVDNSSNVSSSTVAASAVAAKPFQTRSQLAEESSKNLLPPGTELLVRKIKTELKARGAHGFIGMQRKFRIMDDDGNHSLNKAEFNKAMKELQIPLSVAELRILFDYFDRDASGSIDFEEFIQGVRDPLNERRLKLVNKAFSRLDRDGSGFVDAVDIVDVYDASKHPDVISGKRSQKAVLEEFLDTFDVGGVKDGQVSQQEFVNYYSNIGANIDNDDYFELMIRNAWHISGGEGWCANTSNRRVLVTHADGRQTVEEIKDDLGIRPDDKAGMMRALRSQGVNVADVDVFSGNDTQGNKTSNGDDEENVARRGALNVKKLASQAQLQPSVSSTVAPKKASTPDYGLQMIINRLKKEMKSRGAHGFIGMQRKFRIMDDDNSKSLCMSEFKKGLSEMKLDVTNAEMRLLFDHFDADQNGTIGYEEFIQGLRDPLNARRKHLVNIAFSKLDKNNDGVLSPQDIINTYDASNHPDVLSGKSTANDIMQEFLDTFDVGGEKDGKVTRNEFENYYTNLGANIDNDDYFELMIRNAWHISGGEGWCANSSNRRVLVTHADGRETVEEIPGDLGLDADDKPGMMRALRAQGVHAATIEVFNKTDNFDGEEKPRRKKFFNVISGQSSAPTGVLPGTGSSTFAKSSAGSPHRSKNRRYKTPEPTVAVKRIIDRIIFEMKSRGATGFTGMQRKFRIMDDDGSKSLDLSEFKKAMREMNMELTDAELRSVFDHFDVDCSGSIEYEEFVQGVRDPLSDRRLEMVKMAFEKVDRDNSGIVDARDIAECYDASKHPEVIAGRMTPDQVFKQFLDTFDVGGEVDGKVTFNEFVNYYTNLSAGIDNDDYFELMIRNAWHISGGEGRCANTANRRVLVTHPDGRESVQMIEDDLGIKSDDKDGMKRALKSQGVDVSDINLHDAADDWPEPEVKVRRKKMVESTVQKVSAPAGVLPGASGSQASSTNLANVMRTKRADPNRNRSTAGALEIEAKKDGSVMRDALADGASSGAAKKHNGKLGAPDYGLANIIRGLKRELKARGANGFIGLQRKFRIMDDDGSKALNRAEFNKAMKEMRLSLVDSELRMLFEYFDRDNSGSIDFEEFIQGVRDPLNSRRLDLVHIAFDQMDKDGSGYVDATDIMDTYDASKHPEVIAGRKSANQVLEEFLDTFDVGGEKDGKVTRTEFENYYANIGANIDNDDYFELMIRNAWHISGGEGWCANTSNRRVLVTHADGRQTVEEIKDDLGIQPDDKAGMMRALRSQGVSVADVDLFDGDDMKNSSALNPKEKPEQRYFHRKQGRALESTFSLNHDTTKTFREVKDSECAGGAVAYQSLKNRQSGKKKVDNVHLFKSNIVFGDDGGNDKKATKKLLVSILEFLFVRF